MAAGGGACAAERRFEGTEIVVGVQNVPAIGGPAKAHARTWEQRTGGKVRLVEYPFGELYSAYMTSLNGKGGPAFDVLFYAPAWAGDFYRHLSELPPALAGSDAFDDIHPTYRDRLMKWDGKWIAVTVDGDLFMGYYRRDLFEDAANRADFRARYGYDLQAPSTWRQYRDIAEFFTGRAGPDGKAIFGTAEAFARGGQQFWDVFARAAAYVNHPNRPGAQFFNPDTMRPEIDNPGWVRAVTEYVEILKFCPPGAAGYGIVDSRRAFVEGRTAMSLDWGDTGPISADAKLSSVVDKVGFFVLPGTSEVWNGVERRWDKVAQPHRPSFLAFGGWVASVPKNSRNKEAAWDYVLWYNSPENSLRDVVNGDSGVNPFRLTHFSSLDAWMSVFSRRAAAEYLRVIKASLDNPYAALDLRLPGFHDYTESFETHLTKAIEGAVGVEAALAAVARDWDAITDRRNRDQQMAIYRASMGLPRK